RIATYVARHGFDGVDVDIEGPAINGDYGKFISDLSKLLKPKGKLLTAALSQGYGGNKVPESVFKHFDFLNIMAYDATGNWDADNPGQHSSLAFAKSNVTYWLDRGLPKSKAVLGVPFYGYGFGDAYASEGYSYAKIVATYPGAENLDQVGSTIWYNGIPTIQAKAQYVIDRNLAGVMIWSLDNDAKGAKSLLNAIDRTLR
ncbi:MAG: glycoside hydrolase, partial [Opitutaceae bacterium]|nr:glycoside hydrolase [Verrucomicrobiales bacterium]